MTKLNRIETAIAKMIVRRHGWTQAIDVVSAFESPDDKILGALRDMSRRGLLSRFTNADAYSHYYVWARTDEATDARRDLGV